MPHDLAKASMRLFAEKVLPALRAYDVGTTVGGSDWYEVGAGMLVEGQSPLALTKMWGDGFYVEGAKDTKFCGVTADNNRRQGLSIVEANGVLVTDSVFKNTRGTRPSAGIDLEPSSFRGPDVPHRFGARGSPSEGIGSADQERAQRDQPRTHH
ncbi:MAG: right-handed parallel beta-helix repeat-containing protein, partial [Aquincola sp.]|nr:right-handed parallel beta-helix repeat-containing protein [Aquincola sp.]